MDLLTAVNTILPKLGEHVVTSTDAKHPTVAIILAAIEENTRTLLARGWWFNEFDYTAHPDSEGKIALGTEVLQFTPVDSCAVVRGRQLYNPETLSFVFPSYVKGRIRQYVAFDLLPESAANAVLYNTAVQVATTDLGLTAEVQVWAQQANAAMSDMLAEHLRNKRYNTKSSHKFARLRRALSGS